jgi:hypothetical protein
MALSGNAPGAGLVLRKPSGEIVPRPPGVVPRVPVGNIEVQQVHGPGTAPDSPTLDRTGFRIHTTNVIRSSYNYQADVLQCVVSFPPTQVVG